MEPTTKEAQLQVTCKLLIYVLQSLGKQIPNEIANGAMDMYCDVEESVPMLCAEINDMTDNQLNQIMYNGRIKEARTLADWWELHLEADKQREKEKNQKALQENIRQHALSKLTIVEREALGLE